MIFIQNNRDSAPMKLSKALLGDLPTENNNDSFDFNRTNIEVNKFRKPQIKRTDKLINYGKSLFSQTNYMPAYAKTNTNLPLYITGCSPYNPYLIDACKHAIVHIKKDLPNYQDVIDKINTEFGIEDNKKIAQGFNGNFTCHSFSINNNNSNKTILPKIQSFTSTNNSFLKIPERLNTVGNDNDIKKKNYNKNKKITFDTNINNLKKSR